MEQILLVYDLCKATVITIMMLYRINKTPDGDTDYFDIVPELLQGDTMVSFICIIFLDYVLRKSVDLMKENCFNLKMTGSRRYPIDTIMDTDCVEHHVLLLNAQDQVKPLLHSLEQATRGIYQYVNTERTCFKPNGVISSINSNRRVYMH